MNAGNFLSPPPPLSVLPVIGPRSQLTVKFAVKFISLYTSIKKRLPNLPVEKLIVRRGFLSPNFK